LSHFNVQASSYVAFYPLVVPAGKVSKSVETSSACHKWGSDAPTLTFQQAWPAGRNGSNYDGEIKAISEALIKIKGLQIPKTVILSDSKAAIQVIVSKEEKPGDIGV
jgi:hypothetical protein